MLINVHNVSKTYGAITVLQAISFVVNNGDRIGIVGPNGVGKSTLLRLITGQEERDSGSISFAPGTEIGYLPQQTPNFYGRSIQDLLLEAVGNLRQLEERMHILEEAMAHTPEATITPLLNEYSAVSSRFQDAGGYEIDYKIDILLAGLHIDYLPREREVQTLSGGERARVGLVTLLLRSPDILLLDEPTNHLDFASMEWLENYLIQSRSALFMVSHDRQFLNRTVNQIFEINEHNHHLRGYTGNYDAYIKTKETERAKWEEDYEHQQEEIRELRKRIKDAAHNVGHTNRTPHDNDKFARYFFAQNMQSAVASNLRAAEVQLERIEADPIPRPPELLRVNSQFQSEGIASREVISFSQLSKSFGEKTLFQNLTLVISPGERILLTGPNGAGKTTLFKLILGQEKPDSGSVQLAPNIRIGYLSQEPGAFDPQKTVLETYRYGQVGYEGEFIGKLLGYGLFHLEDMQKKVGNLSQGQRRKLEIACLMAQRPNVLLLDEPTNYISLDVLEAFEQAILQFPGPVFVISHDRWFIQRFAGTLWTLEQGQLEIHEKGDANYLHTAWREQV